MAVSVRMDPLLERQLEQAYKPAAARKAIRRKLTAKHDGGAG